MITNQASLKTILVIEDDESIRELLQLALEEEGYQVRVAENGKLGMEKLKQYPDTCLVLLDMMMPVMNGREVLDAVRSDKGLYRIPIIVVSATSDLKQASGANQVIRKPADLGNMLRAVAEYCDCA